MPENGRPLAARHCCLHQLKGKQQVFILISTTYGDEPDVARFEDLTEMAAVIDQWRVEGDLTLASDGRIYRDGEHIGSYLLLTSGPGPSGDDWSSVKAVAARMLISTIERS